MDEYQMKERDKNVYIERDEVVLEVVEVDAKKIKSPEGM